MAHSSDQSPEIITSSPSIRPWSFNKGHSWRGRYLLLILCIVIIIAMVIGTIFVAHHYYHEWGGQGFLKARNTDGRKKSNNSYSSLPLRRVMARGAPGVHTSEHARGTEMHSVPSFYSCGDQQNSCEAYGLPVGPYIRDVRTAWIGLIHYAVHVLSRRYVLPFHNIYYVWHILLQFKCDRVRLSTFRSKTTKMPCLEFRMCCGCWRRLLPQWNSLFGEWLYRV